MQVVADVAGRMNARDGLTIDSEMAKREGTLFFERERVIFV